MIVPEVCGLWPSGYSLKFYLLKLKRGNREDSYSGYVFSFDYNIMPCAEYIAESGGRTVTGEPEWFVHLET
jgi:hypothetical protein